MKIKATKIINLNKNILSDTFNKKNPLIFSGIIIAGIIIGVTFQTIDTILNNESLQKFDEFLHTNFDKTFFELFSGSLLYNLIYVIVPMFLGISAAGFVLIYFIPFIKGLGIGATCALIYSSYGFKGIGYCAVIIFPVALIQFVAIILSCNESYQMSSDLFSVLRKDNTSDEIKINLFLLRYFIIFLIMTASSLLYATCNLVFFKILS